MKHIKELKLNEDISTDAEFEKARNNMKELADYFQMDEKFLMEIIWDGYNTLESSSSSKKASELTDEKIGSLAYSYGLI